MIPDYRIVYNSYARRYRIRKLRNASWARNYLDLGLWTDGIFETRFRWRAAYHVWRLNRKDSALTRTRYWEP